MPPVDAERSTWEVITGTNEGVHRVLIVIHRHQRCSKILKIKGIPVNSFVTLNYKREEFNKGSLSLPHQWEFRASCITRI